MKFIEKMELDGEHQFDNSESPNTSLIDYLNQFAENEVESSYGDFNYSESTYKRGNSI